MEKIDFIKDKEDIDKKVKRSLNSGSIVSIYTRCVVDYSGRSSTDLKEGDRCLLLKPDGVISVQSGEGLRPKNWQPPGGDFSFYYEDDTFVVECVRETDSCKEEVVKVYCLEHYGTVCYQYQDDEEIEMIGSEEDMHDRIMKEPDLVEEGFTALENEKSTEVGDIDIYGVDEYSNPVVIEVKRRKAELKHVDQLLRYTDYMKKNKDGFVRGILIAPEASEKTEDLLEKNDLELVKLDPLNVSNSKTSTEKTNLNDYN